MFVRLTTIFVLIGMLTNQSMVWGHWHVGMSDSESREHDSRPHIHLHSHDTCHDHHHHGHETRADEANQSNSPRGVIQAATFHEHDCGAIYLPAFDLVVSRYKTHSRAINELFPSISPQFATAVIGEFMPEPFAGFLRGKSVSPAPVQGPVYLRTLSLRL